MKYVKIILIILILFVFLNFIGEVKNGNITSKSIFDIRAVQSVGTSVSVVIDNGPPTIFLDSPLNKTYNYNATIKFNEDISITSDTNLDNYIEIGSNLITLNSDGLPDFNKAATLELYSLTFTNPKIKMDGSDCSSTICKINSYSNGTLSFNVTHFTTYSAAETTVSSGAPSGSNTGGGGSGGGSTSSSACVASDLNFEFQCNSFYNLLGGRNHS